ncbi:MAG: DoxX family membrane protein [Acidobacteriaceae bacterium]|nr:DoxX family membrane protein [Acidobacteriaceae bacterium]
MTATVISPPETSAATQERVAVPLFASGIICLGVLGLAFGDFAMQWQPVPQGLPGRRLIAYACALLMLLTGTGLLFERTVKWSVRILWPYLIAWQLLKVPALCVAPQMEAVWLGFGEIVVLLSGGLALFAVFSKTQPVSYLNIARILFGLSLLPIGLSHLFYVDITAKLVPAWLPFRAGFAYLTGVGQIACGLGVLFKVWPRTAAIVESAMLSIFALLVWAPAVIAKPTAQLPWTAFLITWAIAAAAWVIALRALPLLKLRPSIP